MRSFFIIFLIATGNIYGQMTDQQYLSDYQTAVSFYKLGDFDTAFEKLTPLTSQNYKNPVAPYAFLYSAMAAEESNKRYQSKLSFKKLFSFYPDWDKINDAKILYAKQNFEDGYFDEAMKIIDEIDSKDYEVLKNGLMDQYLKNVNTITALKNLYNKYPTYKPLAKALVEKIQDNKYNTKADLELSDMLTNRFDLNAPKTGKRPGKKPGTNQVAKNLNFGLLLPFELNSSGTPTTETRYVYELFTGMELAEEALKTEGINLKIHAYDVRKDAASFNSAKNKSGFDNLDLIIGPLYPTPNRLAENFIQQNDIVQVHPISNNPTLLRNSENSYLFQPSFNMQAKKALDYIKTISDLKTVSIYFSGNTKDSTFAYTYSTEAKAQGFKVTEIKRYNQSIKLSPQKGHIFFVGDNNQGVQFLQKAEGFGLDCQILVTANSFNWFNINTDLFKNNISLIYPEFINSNKEKVKEFEKAYYSKTNGFPSYYSYLGYDLAYYFASSLNEGKNMFKINLNVLNSNDDYMLSGYNFTGNVRQNQIVPIIKFVSNEFVEVYR